MTSESVISNEEVLKVTIHGCENFFNSKVTQPALCMHVINENTGSYVKKSDKNRSVVSFYENQRDELDYIIPIMTQSCLVSNERLTVVFKWEEAFILNEKYETFINENSNVILFFELIDMVPLSVIKNNYGRLNSSGMRKLAWAFLKLRSANKVINTGSKLRLQLYKPGNSFKSNKNNVIDVFHWWRRKQKSPLQASLYISVEPFCPHSVEPAMRSFLPIQQERGSASYEKFGGVDTDPSINYVDVPDGAQKKNMNFLPDWSRRKGEPCKIPTKKLLLLDTGNSCQALKFSNSGRLLVAGCGSQSCYYIIVYQIPDGNILQKILAHSEVIYDLDWSNKDNFLLSASGDCNVKMWNTNNWNLVACFVHPSYVYAAKFHPKDQLLASACYDHIVRIWDIEKQQLISELEGHNSAVCSLCWNFSGTKLYSADGLGQIKIWSKSRSHGYSLKKDISPSEIENVSISKILLDCKEAFLYIFSCDSFARILDMTDGSVFPITTELDPSPVKSQKGCCSPCGNLLFFSNDKKNILVWDKNSSCFKNIPFDLNYGNISCMEFNPLDHMIAIGFQNDAVPIHIFVYEKSDDEKTKEKEICRRMSNSTITSSNLKNNSSEKDCQVLDTNSMNNEKGKINRLAKHELASKTKRENFNNFSITGNTSSLKSSTIKNALEPIIPYRSAKRSERRKKLLELTKSVLCNQEK